MKKFFIFALLFLCCSYYSYCQHKLKVIPKIRLEYFFLGNERISPDGLANTISSYPNSLGNHVITFYGQDNVIIDLGDFRSDMGIEFQYRSFSIHFDNTTYFKNLFRKGIRFDPTQINFTVKIQYQIKNTGFKFYYAHSCYHPIKSYRDSNGKYLRGYYGGNDRIGFSYNY